MREGTGSAPGSRGRGAVPLDVEQLLASLVEETTERDPLEGGGEHARRDAREADDVRARGRPERGEVPADQMLGPFLLGDVGRITEPVGREPVEVGAGLVPGAERRDPDEVHPEPDPVPRGVVEPEGRDDLGTALGPAGQEPRGLRGRARRLARRPAEAPDHPSRRCSRTAAENSQKSRLEAMWIVVRIIHAWTTAFRCSARVRSSRRKPSWRVRRAM